MRPSPEGTHEIAQDVSMIPEHVKPLGSFDTCSPNTRTSIADDPTPHVKAEDSPSARDPLMVIVNYIPPYNREVAGFLAAPIGAKTRFRFQAKYVQPHDLDIASVRNRDVLICLRNRHTGQLMPLRAGIGVSGRWRAGLAVFDVSLQEIAAAPNGEVEAQSWQEVFSRELAKELSPFCNDGDQDLKKLVFFSSKCGLSALQDARSSSLTEDKKWANLINLISILCPIKQKEETNTNEEKKPNQKKGKNDEDQLIDFFKVIQILDTHGKPVTPKPGEFGRASYELTQGQQYAIEIAQRTYTGIKGDSSVPKPRRIVLTSSSDDIERVEPDITIHGKYSDSELYFSVSRRATEGPRHTRLEIVRSNNIVRYGCELPIIIVRSKSSTFWSAVSLVGFILSLLVFIFPGLIDILFSSLNSWGASVFPVQPSRDAVEKLSILGMILSSAGNPMARFLTDRLKIG